jgi:hypothetical protein
MFNRFRSLSTPSSILLIVSGDRVPFCAVEAAGSANRQNAAKQWTNNLLFIIGFTSVIVKERVRQSDKAGDSNHEETKGAKKEEEQSSCPSFLRGWNQVCLTCSKGWG